MNTATLSKSKIISISLPNALAKQAIEQARALNKSKSQLFQEALQQFILTQKWQELQEYGLGRAIALGIKPEDTQKLINEYRQGQ